MQTHRPALTYSFLFVGLLGALALTGCQQATPPAEEASETSSPSAEADAATTDPSVISTEDFESGEVSAVGGESAEGEDTMGAGMDPSVDAAPSDPPSDDDDGSGHD